MAITRGQNFLYQIVDWVRQRGGSELLTEHSKATIVQGSNIGRPVQLIKHDIYFPDHVM